MYYALVDILALIILLITNHDVVSKKKQPAASNVHDHYRRFLFAVIIYYLTDMFWGILDSLSFSFLLYADTEIYFIVMGLGVLFWTQYVNSYLEEDNRFSVFLQYAGRIFFSGMTVMIILNLFIPVMFWVDQAGRYHTAPARYITLIVQIIILLLTVIYALKRSSHTEDPQRNRHLAIGLSGLIMLVLIAVQIFYPLLPLYAISYMLGCCLLRTFVVENEREEYRKDLETALQREKRQLQELNTTRKLLYTDTLTGAGSKLAFAETTDNIDKAISDGTIGHMATAVFDINDLKKINDSLGHEAGDEHIIKAYGMISGVFRHSAIFRIGGDEFVAVLQKEDYENRTVLMESFTGMILENKRNDSLVISAGMAEYVPGQDKSYKRLFERADHRMYKQKNEFKRGGTVLPSEIQKDMP